MSLEDDITALCAAGLIVNAELVKALPGLHDAYWEVKLRKPNGDGAGTLIGESLTATVRRLSDQVTASPE